MKAIAAELPVAALALGLIGRLKQLDTKYNAHMAEMPLPASRL
jgi:hypothetical protein